MKKTRSLLLALGLAATAATATDLEAERARISSAFEALDTNAEGLTEAERLERYDELSEEYGLLEFPEMATFRGLDGDHGRWSDRSREASERGDAHALRMLELVRGIDRDQLEGDDRLNYDLLLERLESGVEGQRFMGDYLQINQMGGPHSSITRMLSMMPTFRLDQYEDILSRMAGAPEVIRTTMDWLREGLEKGVTPPRITMRDVPSRCRP